MFDGGKLSGVAHSWAICVSLFDSSSLSPFVFRFLSSTHTHTESGLKVHISWAGAASAAYKWTHVQHLPSIDFLLKTTTFNYGVSSGLVFETSRRQQENNCIIPLFTACSSSLETKSFLTPRRFVFDSKIPFLNESRKQFSLCDWSIPFTGLAPDQNPFSMGKLRFLSPTFRNMLPFDAVIEC